MGGLSLLVIIIGVLLRKKKLLNFEGYPFECGISVLRPGEIPLRLRFFLLTVIFLVFDVELVLVLPYVFYDIINWGEMGILIFCVFIFSLIIGVFIEWNFNCFEWV